jgi:hypothetical protein
MAPSSAPSAAKNDASAGAHDHLSRGLLSWLSARGNHRLVAVLLELEATYIDTREPGDRPDSTDCGNGLRSVRQHNASLSTSSSQRESSPRTSGTHPTEFHKNSDPIMTEALLLRRVEALLSEFQAASGVDAGDVLADLARLITRKRWQVGHPIKMREIEAEVVATVVSANDGDRLRSAVQLGVSVRRLDYRLKASQCRATAKHECSGMRANMRIASRTRAAV